ncbi:MAG: GTPase [Burkholderiaceae bacterium]|nr:GTPase [Burkholderiaceae bacterium]
MPTWLVTGTGREALIAARLAQDGQLNTVVILEGLPSGQAALADLAEVAAHPAPLQVLRIAPGCLHCSGNLILRVTLNRVLRRPPQRLYLGLASAEHLALLRDFLSAPPYATLLDLQADLLS